MKPVKAAYLLPIFLLWALTLPLMASLSDNSDVEALPQPSVDLKPDDVVRIVIGALAHNDKPFANAGITTTFAFASPANKVNTGPLDKFTRMVKGEPYGIMVDHVASEFSEVVYQGNNAYMMVNLTSAAGRSVVFAFRMSKQLDGEFKDMWMTDAVWPVANHTSSQQAF